MISLAFFHFSKASLSASKYSSRDFSLFKSLKKEANSTGTAAIASSP
jgi:hypothetical protein